MPDDTEMPDSERTLAAAPILRSALEIMVNIKHAEPQNKAIHHAAVMLIQSAVDILEDGFVK